MEERLQNLAPDLDEPGEDGRDLNAKGNDDGDPNGVGQGDRAQERGAFHARVCRHHATEIAQCHLEPHDHDGEHGSAFQGMTNAVAAGGQPGDSPDALAPTALAKFKSEPVANESAHEAGHDHPDCAEL